MIAATPSDGTKHLPSPHRRETRRWDAVSLVTANSTGGLFAIPIVDEF